LSFLQANNKLDKNSSWIRELLFFTKVVLS